MQASSAGFRSPWVRVRRGLTLIALVLAGCGGSEGPAPVSVDSVYPTRGSTLGGTLIQLRGEGFTPTTRVAIGEGACGSLTVLSASSLTCITPAHAQGTVDIHVSNLDGGQATASNLYTYRPSGTGVSSFGILAATPPQGVYPMPFSAKLLSVLADLDLSTATRTWVVNGETYEEGDTVPFEVGSHTVTLAVRDASGDSDSITYSIVVGEMMEPTLLNTGRSRAMAADGGNNTFVLGPDRSIALSNTGFLPLVNPRLIGAGKPDYVDWLRYLNSLARLGALPTDASEGSRAALLEAAWKDLSNATVHVCSPGREAENIYDPTLLIRGYGYECCSNAARALANLGSFLDIPSRVRTTAHHEFPEFTVGGNMFILDPDLRYRFWSDSQLPLSAWTSPSAPLSLMNVGHYYAQSSTGEMYEVPAGGLLPYGNLDQFPEETFRSFYTTDILGETVWGYHEAHSNPSYLLYPSERMAYRRTSSYVPLQWLNSDGSPNGGSYAPAVGKVVFRRLWSTIGPRKLQQDDSGNWVIPLNDLPYPIQDLVFYFSKPIDPQGFLLASAGRTYQLGRFEGNSWTVSDQQLRGFSSLSDLAAIIPADQSVVAVDIGMQFNPGIFGDPAGAVSLSYSDDSGACLRSVRATSGSDAQDFALGSISCDPQAPQRVQTSYSLKRDEPGRDLIAHYGNSYQGTWGLAAAAGIRAYAEIVLPRTPGLSGLLRVNNEGHVADWQMFEDGQWRPLGTTDARISQWINLPAASSSSTRLRVTLREPLATQSTYLSYLSLIEGRDFGSALFAGSSTGLQ